MSKGIVCPACGGATHVTDSRPQIDAIRRRRACLTCDARITTYEVMADNPVQRAMANRAVRLAIRILERASRL